MKLIIDIPEKIYKDIIEDGFIYDEDNEIVTDVIKNGTPLDKIKADILNLNSTSYEIHWFKKDVLAIIDKYRNEVSP